MEETLITIDILKEVNLPKLIADDVPVFEDIIRDLFTETEAPKVNPKRLEVIKIRIIIVDTSYRKIFLTLEFFNVISHSV